MARLVTALETRLPSTQQEGLDFGSGPGPVLAQLLAERGHRVALFDPHFAPDPAVLERRYDFVTCTEVVEHFREPGREWDKLMSLLKPGGWLGIMTKLADRWLESPELFATWFYIRDLTHLCFYSRRTIQYLARCHGLRVEWGRDDMILLQQSSGTVG
ncbi:MAG: class I SAM-dependent methyltransferase [Planctomycetota bacterium]